MSSIQNIININWGIIIILIYIIICVYGPDLIDSIIYENMQPDCPVPIMTQSEAIHLMERAYAK